MENKNKFSFLNIFYVAFLSFIILSGIKRIIYYSNELQMLEIGSTLFLTITASLFLYYCIKDDFNTILDDIKKDRINLMEIYMEREQKITKEGFKKFKEEYMKGYFSFIDTEFLKEKIRIIKNNILFNISLLVHLIAITYLGKSDGIIVIICGILLAVSIYQFSFILEFYEIENKRQANSQ